MQKGPVLWMRSLLPFKKVNTSWNELNTILYNYILSRSESLGLMFSFWVARKQHKVSPRNNFVKILLSTSQEFYKMLNVTKSLKPC